MPAQENYYHGLEAADQTWTTNLIPDVRKLESLISGLLVEQVGSVVNLDAPPDSAMSADA